MQELVVKLSTQEFEALNKEFENSGHNKTIGDRAIAIVMNYFKKNYSECKFEVEVDDADLVVRAEELIEPLLIEVKGTSRTDIAMGQLKVSGDPSYSMLVESKIPVYRVTKVFEIEPKIYVLKHGEDFELVPEPRWRFAKASSGGTGPTSKRVPTNGRCAKNRRSPSASKYASLTRFLGGRGEEEVILRLNKAQRILGFPLCKSATEHRAFWANQTDVSVRPQANAWRKAGYYVHSVNLSEKNGSVVFRRYK